MTEELNFDEELSFKFKGGCTLDDLVLVFCNYFDEENKGHYSTTKVANLVPGKVVAVEASREWLLGGEGVAVLILYSNDDETGGVASYLYSTNSNSMWADRPMASLHQQIGKFFKEGCRELIELQGQTELELQSDEQPSDREEVISDRWPQGWLTPIGFCGKCGAAIAIDESTYCWNCGAELPREVSAEPTSEEAAQKGGVHCDEVEYDRRCMICKLGFKDGDLLAWCPKCGAPAHRIHMLEWMHVKGSCQACGEQLEIQKMEEQLSQAHLQRSSKTTLQVRKRDAKLKKH